MKSSALRQSPCIIPTEVVNDGNMCSFSGATCTSRVRHNASYVPCAQIRFDL